MKSLYLDLYFFFNLLADYLVCLSAARLCSIKLHRKRYMLAALFGAGYAVLSKAPRLSFLVDVPWKLAASLLMGIFAFSGESSLLRCILVMLTTAFTFGGSLYALMQAGEQPFLSFRTLLSVFFLSYGILKLLAQGLSRWDGQSKAEIQLVFLGRQANFAALVDSGNSLRCPDTGANALIVSPRALRPIFQDYTVCLEELSPVDLVKELSRVPDYAGRLRLIPFRSLGGGGLIPVFHPDHIWINGKEANNLIIAISGEVRGNGFEAIL